MLDAMQRVPTAAGYAVTRRSYGYGTFHLSVTERPSWRLRPAAVDGGGPRVPFACVGQA